MTTFIIVYLLGLSLNLIFLYLMRQRVIEIGMGNAYEHPELSNTEKLIVIGIGTFLIAMLSIVILPVLMLNYFKKTNE